MYSRGANGLSLKNESQFSPARSIISQQQLLRRSILEILKKLYHTRSGSLFVQRGVPEKRLLAGMACGEFGTRALLMVEWPLFSNKAPILAQYCHNDFFQIYLIEGLQFSFIQLSILQISKQNPVFILMHLPNIAIA